MVTIIFEKKKKKKSVKQSKIITLQPKTIENPNIIYIKSGIIKHNPYNCTYSKTTRQAKIVSQVSGAGKNSMSPLYSETKKSEKFFDEKKIIKNAKIMMQSIAYKGYVSTYNFEILNSFNYELQPKDTDSVVRNKLNNLVTKLKGFIRFRD